MSTSASRSGFGDGERPRSGIFEHRLDWTGLKKWLVTAVVTPILICHNKHRKSFQVMLNSGDSTSCSHLLEPRFLHGSFRIHVLLFPDPMGSLGMPLDKILPGKRLSTDIANVWTKSRMASLMPFALIFPKETKRAWSHQ